MPSLSTINENIIREIGLWLLQDKSTLCALALTHRNIYNVIPTLLTRNIEVWVKGSSVDEIKRYNHLMRTLESQPHLGAATWSLQLKWGSDSRWDNTDEIIANERAERLLNLTPNIRSLDIRNWSYKCSPFTVSPHFLRKLTFLKEITLVDPRTTVHEIVQLMQVPYLSTLRVQSMCGQMSPKSQSSSDPAILNVAPHMEHLRLPQELRLDPPSFNFLLTTASSIKSLSANLPGLQPLEMPRGARAQREARMLERLSPAGILACLSPIQETLVDLDLIDAGLRWPGHDGSRLNLSQFVCMKKVSLCATCIFVPDGPWDGRKGVDKLLPSTIEEINIEFNSPQGFLYTTFEIPTLFDNEPDEGRVLSSIHPERYSWLTELVDQAVTVPRLRFLCLKERTKGRHGLAWGWAWWKPPLNLKAQFELIDWDVRIFLRIPKKKLPTLS